MPRLWFSWPGLPSEMTATVKCGDFRLETTRGLYHARVRRLFQAALVKKMPTGKGLLKKSKEEEPPPIIPP